MGHHDGERRARPAARPSPTCLGLLERHERVRLGIALGGRGTRGGRRRRSGASRCRRPSGRAGSRRGRRRRSRRRNGGSSTSTNARTPPAEGRGSPSARPRAARARRPTASASTSASPSEPSTAPSGLTTSRAPGSTARDLGLQRRDDADRPLFLERHRAARPCHRGRALGGLDEHLDRAVAAEPEPPHVVVVGGEVPAGEARACPRPSRRAPCRRRRPPGSRR